MCVVGVLSSIGGGPEATPKTCGVLFFFFFKFRLVEGKFIQDGQKKKTKQRKKRKSLVAFDAAHVPISLINFILEKRTLPQCHTCNASVSHNEFLKKEKFVLLKKK